MVLMGLHPKAPPQPKGNKLKGSAIMPKLLTEEQLADYLSVCRITVKRYREDCGMPYLMLGSKMFRYDLNAVLAWMDVKEVV